LLGGRICQGYSCSAKLYDLDESFKLVFRRHSNLAWLHRSRSDVWESQAEREVVRAGGEMVLDDSFSKW
ncbi:hypothetical protein PTT_02665, partial [Pyrenophora teres f. teres 0-1]